MSRLGTSWGVMLNGLIRLLLVQSYEVYVSLLRFRLSAVHRV